MIPFLWQSNTTATLDFRCIRLLVLQQNRKNARFLRHRTTGKKTLQQNSSLFIFIQKKISHQSFSGLSHPILPAKCCTDCILLKSEVVQICFGRPRDPSTDWPAKQLHSLTAMLIRIFLPFQLLSNHLSALDSFRRLPLPTILA